MTDEFKVCPECGAQLIETKNSDDGIFEHFMECLECGERFNLTPPSYDDGDDEEEFVIKPELQDYTQYSDYPEYYDANEAAGLLELEEDDA